MAVYVPLFILIFGVHINPLGFLRGLPVLLIGTVGMIGLGMTAAGIVLYLKDPGPFINILEMLVFALSGAMYPVSILPKPLQLLANAMPYAPTSEAVRKVVAFGYSNALGELGYLILISLVYSISGYLAYRWSERQARILGLKSY